ncbi:MAG: hypothetical protein ACFCU8_17095 [Thermosynechococcaceae cyanobacterium]
MPFADILEAIDQLSLDEQATLMNIVQNRLAAEGRKQLAAEVQSAQREFAQGLCKTTTVDELMTEILA